MVTQFSGDMFRDDSSSSNLSPQKKVVDTQKGCKTLKSSVRCFCLIITFHVYRRFTKNGR